jgi:autotransporter-associated beta strand protein
VYGQVENVDHLWLVEGGDVFTETGVLSIKTGGSIQVFPGAVNDPATISGTVEFLPGAHDINVAASTASTGGPDLDVAAMFTSAGETVTLQKMNNGKMRLSANNDYVGSTVVNGGTVQVDGSQPSSSVVVNGGGRLSGTGRTGPVTFSNPSGVVAPGGSPGILTVDNFNLDGAGGILQLELDGGTAGSGYDRLSVRGLVDLRGITLQASVNFPATNGQQFTIVGNDLLDAINGEFNGLPEGASVAFSEHIFQITYAGGTGNDVVLTQIGEVYRPVLTIERVEPSSVRLLWPASDPAFTLQFTTNLSGTNFSGWTTVPGTPSTIGTNQVVTNSSSGAGKLYRLFKP